ncbi:MAG: hypothetical protein Q8L53_07875 [Aestuariivirga sp.]|nr:hypothetical protein [Aestuariivirga sp.]
MPRIQTVIRSVLFGLAVLVLSPSNLPAQFFGGSSYKADTAILSAGSRAAAISRLRAVPSVGVVNLNIRTVPRFRSNETDVAEYKVSVGKNFSGIKRLRSALASNPVTRRALGIRGISIGRVVGVDISSNGSLRLYVL